MEVGGGSPQDALQQLLGSFPFWVSLAGLAACYTGLASGSLPPSLDALTASLAPANRPLMLLAAGMTLPPFELPPARLVSRRKVLHRVAARMESMILQHCAVRRGTGVRAVRVGIPWLSGTELWHINLRTPSIAAPPADRPPPLPSLPPGG